MRNPVIVESILTFVGAVLAAALLASAGFFGYERQKNADRKYDLDQLKQQEYQRYLLAFQEASRWKGVDDERHEEAESAYHTTQNYMLLHASETVIRAVNSAHRYYVEVDSLDWREYKRLYATMIISMRADGYTPTTLSIEEIDELRITVILGS